MPEQNQKTNTTFSDLLKASWMRSSIKLALALTVIGIFIIALLKLFNIAETPLFSRIEIFFMNYGLLGIFLATIIAGTIIPLGSPALVVAAALCGVNPVILTLVATTGFTIGMTINYTLAYHLGNPYVAKRIPPEHIKQIKHLWSKWGWIIYITFGLIPVLPVELLAFICGLLKTRITIFITLSFIPRFIIFTLLSFFGQSAGTWLGIA